jgi:hypothetical protein
MMTPKSHLGSGQSSVDYGVASSLGSGESLSEKIIVENSAIGSQVVKVEVHDVESAESLHGVERPRHAQGHGLSAGKSPEDAGEITGADLRWVAKDLLSTLFGDNSQADAC